VLGIGCKKWDAVTGIEKSGEKNRNENCPKRKRASVRSDRQKVDLGLLGARGKKEREVSGGRVYDFVETKRDQL